MQRYEGLPEPVIPLTEFETTPLYAEQLGRFTVESIHASPVMNFNPGEALVTLGLERLQGQPVVAVDIGGDTAVTNVGWLANEKLVFEDQTKKVVKSTHGLGYMALLEEVSRYAQANGLPIGISYAGPIEGSTPIDGKNVEAFLEELDQKYDGDFANLFPTLAVARNDAVAGLISGSIQAKKQLKDTTNVIYLINGSGIGGAALAGIGNEVIEMEPGHVAVIPALNPENQQKPCGMFGNNYTCIENVAGTKAGIEDIWLNLTDERLTGKQIQELYEEGNWVAADLYNDSAILVAHTVQGIANALRFDLASKATAVVGHGGAFKFPLYGKRVQQVLGYSLGKEPRLLMTQSYSANACLDGAALSALLEIQR